MTILWWTLIVLCFVVSFVGLIYPIIPSVVLVWAGVLIYHFFIDQTSLSMWTWITFGVSTALLFLADYLANAYFVKKYGGSKWGLRAATVGLILGSFILPPIGVLVVPFVFVLVAEFIQKKNTKESFMVAIGTLIAFLSGTIAKGFIQFPPPHICGLRNFHVILWNILFK